MYKSVIPVNGEGGEFRHVDYAYNPHLSTGDNSSLSLYNHQAGLAESRFNTQPLPPTRRMVDEPSREIYAQTIAPLRESIDNRPVDPRGVTVIHTGGSTLSHHHHGNNSKVHSSTVFIPADSREESRVDEKELARRFKKKFGNGENRLMRHDSAERVDSPCDCVTLSVLACLCMCPIGIISLYCAVLSRKRYMKGQYTRAKSACRWATVLAILAFIAAAGLITALCLTYIRR